MTPSPTAAAADDESQAGGAAHHCSILDPRAAAREQEFNCRYPDPNCEDDEDETRCVIVTRPIAESR